MKYFLDLTHPVGENTIQWPTATKFKVLKAVASQFDDYYYESRDISTAEHAGTHTDAPAHFCRDRWHTADIPLTRLTGPGVKIDIEQRVETDPDTDLLVEDILAWQRRHGDIPEKSVVVVHTGRGKLYGEKRKYFGRPDTITDERDVANLHFPGVSPAAAQWLVDHDVVGVAIDTPSTDRGQSKTFPTHQVLCQVRI